MQTDNDLVFLPVDTIADRVVIKKTMENQFWISGCSADSLCDGGSWSDVV